MSSVLEISKKISKNKIIPYPYFLDIYMSIIYDLLYEKTI